MAIVVVLLVPTSFQLCMSYPALFSLIFEVAVIIAEELRPGNKSFLLQ